MTLHTQERPSVIPFPQNDNHPRSVPPSPFFHDSDADDDEPVVTALWAALICAFVMCCVYGGVIWWVTL